MEDKEKNEIKDAEVGEVKSEIETEIDTDAEFEEKPKNRSYHTEIILIFIIGLLLGIMAKAESLKTFSIGFSDYRLKGGAHEYNLDEIEKKIIEEAEKGAQEMEQQGQANEEDQGVAQ